MLRKVGNSVFVANIGFFATEINGYLIDRFNESLINHQFNGMKLLIKYIAGIAILFSLEGFMLIQLNQAKIPEGIRALDSKFVQEPSITVEETSVSNMIVIYVTDSASSSAAVSQKFMQILPVELGGFLKKSNLHMAGPPCGWYYGNHFPMMFDIGVPVNQIPVATEGRIKVKQMVAGKAVVAHYYGPYDQIGKGYTVAMAWIKDHQKISIAPPYEVYVGDPGVEKDPYKVLTNIVFPVN